MCDLSCTRSASAQLLILPVLIAWIPTDYDGRRIAVAPDTCSPISGFLALCRSADSSSISGSDISTPQILWPRRESHDTDQKGIT